MVSHYDNQHVTGWSADEAALATVNVVPTITLAIGATRQMVSSDQGDPTQEIWASDAPGICSVSASGLATAVSAGTANLSVTNGAYVASAMVTVSP